jgi:hypothetical protein
MAMTMRDERRAAISLDCVFGQCLSGVFALYHPRQFQDSAQMRAIFSMFLMRTGCPILCAGAI